MRTLRALLVLLVAISAHAALLLLRFEAPVAGL